MSNILPEQRTSVTKKKNVDWYKATYDYYVDRAISLNDKSEVEECLKAANGIIDKKTFEYVLNPLGAESKDLEGNLPGELRNTDFITPIRERNLGEYIELPYKFFTKVNNPDAVLKRNAELNVTAEKVMQQNFINMLNENDVDTGVDTKEQVDLVEFRKNFLEKWFDERAVKGKKILNLINDLTDFDQQRYQNFYYWWATEEFYTYRYIRNNEFFREVITPLEGYPVPNGSMFVEDYDAFVIRRKISWSQFLDKYSEKLSDKDIEFVKNLSTSFSSTGKLTTSPKFLKTRFGEEFDTKIFGEGENLEFADINYDFDEWIILFKTEIPVYILSYENVMGELLETEVPNTYELDPAAGDISIKKEWRQVTHKGVRIGDKDKGFYLESEEELVQRYDPITKSCKLPVGGRQGIMWDVPRNPVPKRLIPYLAMDRILYLKFERTLAKHKGDILVIPKGMMNPDEAGTTKQKYFYMYADNTIMYDETLIDLNTVNQGFRVVGNPGLERFLESLVSIRRDNKAEAWELANMNNERYGATANSQTVTNAQQNIYRAKLGSTLMITQFHAALEKDHTADLEFSKFAWINGKSGSYFEKETNTMVPVDVDPREHPENDYGIFIRNSKAEEAMLEAYRELAFSAAQNGDSELASEAIAADSVPELRQFIKRFSESKREYETAMKERETEAIKYSTDKQAEIAKEDRDTEIAMNTENNETKVEVAYIQAMGFNDETKGQNTFSDADILKLAKERREEVKQRLAVRQQLHKENIDNEKLKILKRKPKSK